MKIIQTDELPEKVVIEGEINAYLDSGWFVEVGGAGLADLLTKLGVLELDDEYENKGKKKVRITVEVLD